MINELPELDLARFHGRPRAARPAASSSRGCATPATDPGSAISSATACPRSSMLRSWPSAREFFALPLADERALAIARSPHFRGYTVLGDERTKGVSDWREQLDVGAEEPALPSSPPASPPGDGYAARTNGPRGYPRCNRRCSRGWRAMDRVGLAVLRALALGLGPTPRLLRRLRAAARRSAFEDHPLPRAAARRR